ncbi:hypothetical protein V6N13_103817 [Hibiscus sabdariffa]|uniref:Uncharacterized protein n=2 Tax=Hibiscus sabdariffa TaxID=183260 RepID=A0ABR2NTF9_9ROSI
MGGGEFRFEVQVKPIGGRTRPPQGGEVAPAPHIFGGQGHLKVARWSPQASATRLRTAARLEWLWPAPGLLEMARSVESL